MKKFLAFVLLLTTLFGSTLRVSAVETRTKEEQLYQMLEEGIRNRIGMDGKSYIDLSTLKLSNADGSADRALLNKTLKRVVFDHPEFYYVSDSYYRHHYTNNPNALAGLRPAYYAFAEDPETEARFTQAVEEALAQVEGILDPVEQMLVLHDYLLANSVYNWELGLDPKDKNAPSYARSAYGALAAHDAVCAGYARAWQLLMDRLGIPCVTVASEGGEHVWNLVAVNGAWYHVDVNNDNNVFPTIQGRSMHVHFLQSDQARRAINRYQSWYALNPVRNSAGLYEGTPVCNSEIYDTGWAFRDKLNYPMHYQEGLFYYVRKTGPNHATVLRGMLSGPAETLANIRANNRSGAVWQGNFLYYVDAKDETLKRCSLLNGEIVTIGTIPFTPQPSPDGHFDADSDGIGLYFDATTQEIAAVSRTRRTNLVRFSV